MTRIDQPTAPLGLVFATMSRPHVAQRLIESVRRFFPDMPIYVADQTHPTPQQQAFYDQTGCKVAWLDHDAGVCASRNAAVAMVSEPYFVLCDDDFIFTDETDLSRALTVLEARPDIGVAACDLEHARVAVQRVHSFRACAEGELTGNDPGSAGDV